MSETISSIPSPRPIRKAGLGIGSSLCLCLVFFAATFVGGFIAGLASRSFGTPLNLSSMCLIPLVVAWIITIKLGLQWMRTLFRTTCPLTGFPLRTVPPLLLASFGASIVLSEATLWIPMPESLRDSLVQQFKNRNILSQFLLVVVVAPFAEELFFRGMVLRSYLSRYSVRASVWGSAVLFAAFHLNPWQAVVALPLGVWYARMFLRTGSLMPGMISHAMVNFSTCFLVFPLAIAMGFTEDQILALRHYPASMLMIGAVATLLGGGVLWRQLADMPLLQDFDLTSAEIDKDGIAGTWATAPEKGSETDAEPSAAINDWQLEVRPKEQT